MPRRFAQLVVEYVRILKCKEYFAVTVTLYRKFLEEKRSGWNESMKINNCSQHQSTIKVH